LVWGVFETVVEEWRKRLSVKTIVGGEALERSKEHQGVKKKGRKRKKGLVGWVGGNIFNQRTHERRDPEWCELVRRLSILPGALRLACSRSSLPSGMV
jgi:hypothetical protein